MDKVKQEIKSAKRDRKLSSLDNRIIRPDGSERIIHSEQMTIFQDGEPDRVFGADQDVTERKQIEEALIKSEDKCRTLVEYVNDCIWETDKDSHFTYVSPRSQDILGYEPKEMMGKTPYDFMPDDATKEMFAIVYQDKIEGKPFAVEYPFTHKDGCLVHARISGEPTFDNNGGFNGFIGLTSDVTKRILAEEQLEDAKDQAELYVDLPGHDINNMNQVAIGYAELTWNAMEQGVCDPSMLEKTMEMLYNSSKLINNVRKIQKIKTGEVKPEIVDLGALFKEASGRYKSILRSGDNINYNIECDCKVVASDLLKDVFLNLISNAVKHSAGPANIDIELTKVYECDKEYCMVAVSDNGPGIPDEKKKELFHRFTRGATKAKGTGLDLYLVKELVENFGGCVWVEDRVPGNHTKGSKFVVLLPRVET